MSKSIHLNKVITELLSDYFDKLEKSKKFEEGWREKRKVLSHYDEDLLNKRIENNFNEPFIINAKVTDFEGDGEFCILENPAPLNFTFNHNSEEKRVKLTFSLGNDWWGGEKELFDPNLINEFCDVKIQAASASCIFYELSGMHIINISIFEQTPTSLGEILSLHKEEEKWYNAKLFGQEIKTETTKSEPLSKKKGCMSFFSCFL